MPSFWKGKVSVSVDKDFKPYLLRGILFSPFDDLINLNRQTNGLARIKVSKNIMANKPEKGKKRRIWN